MRRNRSEHPNAAVALVGEINSTSVVYRDPHWSRDFCCESRPPIATKPAHSIARDRAYDSRGGVHPSYPVIQGIRDVEIAGDVQRNCRCKIQEGAGGRSAIAGVSALANRYTKRRRARRTRGRTSYGIDDPSTSSHFANAGVLEVRNVDVSETIYCARDWIPEMSIDGRPVVPAETCPELSGHRTDHTGSSRYFSNSIPATTEINISCTIHGDPRWSGNAGVSRWPSVASVCRRACTCDRCNHSGRYLDSPYAIVIGIGNVDVPGVIERETHAFSDHRAGCLTPVTAIA